MAEALGVAASVAGLITIADIVVRRGYDFIKLVAEARETVEKVICEVNWLFGMLHSLQNVATRLEGDAQTLDPTMQIKWIEPCHQTLSKIQGLLQKAMAGGSMTRMEKIKWPLRQSATLELLKDIERHKSNVSLALNAKEMSALCEIRDGVQTLKTAFDAQQTVQNQIVLDDERCKMLQIFGEISARKWQDSNIRLRQPGTGIWFTEGSDFKGWLSQERSKLWINGIPGAGKTVLMSSTIQKIESELKSREALAFFYCDYKDSSTHSASTILGCLAKQLIMRHEDCFDDLTIFYEEHISPDRSIRTPSPEELCQLISKVSTHFETVMIVVDGLDEITHGRAEVSRFLASLHATSSSIKTLFSSRPEVDIGHVLNDFQTISIAAQSSDIRLYIASEIERRIADARLEINDPNLKEHIMATLADRCDGMFRWVACQMDYLCECSNDRDRREALTKLPPDLPSSYERILDRVNRSTKENQTLVRGALHWISYAYQNPYSAQSFTTKGLLQALAVREGHTAFDSSRMTTERQLLHWCSSLVRKNPASGRLELAHFTVEEFLNAIDPLGSPCFVQYRLSGDHSVLAKACIRLLRCEEFDGRSFPHIPATDDDVDDPVDLFCEQYPFFHYAATMWSYHVHKSDPEEIDKVVVEFFMSEIGPTFQRMAAIWRHEYEMSIEFPADSMDLPNVADNNMWPSPLHWAACFSLDRICMVLVDNGADINRQSILGTPLCCSMMFALSSVATKIAWCDTLRPLYGATWISESQQRATLKTLLQAGSSTNIPASPDHVKVPLDLATQIVAKNDYLSHPSLFLIELLRSGARLSADNLDTITSEFLREALSGGDPDFAECIWALVEAAVRAKWHPWNTEHLAHLFSITLSHLWDVTAHQAGYVDAAIEETFQDVTVLELNSSFHNENGDRLNQVARTVLRTIELSCETSKAFNQKMWRMLLRMLTLERVDFSACSSLLSLCPRLDVTLQDETMGQSLLHMCIEVAYSETTAEEENLQPFIEMLLKRGASVIATDHDGKSPLNIAAESWNLEIFMLLWESTSFAESEDTCHDLVNRILYDAISWQAIDLAGFLLREMAVGPQPDCVSFLTFALGQEDTDIVSQILAAYANVPQLWTVALLSLHLASRPDVSFSVFDWLLSTRRIPNSLDGLGNTPIHYLVLLHDDTSRAKLQLLIGSDRSLDDFNKDGMTPLALAVRCKNFAATEILLEAGANVNLFLPRGQTVMHLAACLGNTEAVELLLAKGCYHAIKNDLSMTPEELALACGHDHIATMIRNAMIGDDGMNITDVIRSDGKINPGLHDPHCKLPLRIVDRNSGYLIPPDSGSTDLREGFQGRNSFEDTRSSKMASPETPLERSQLEATPDICDSSSVVLESSSMHIFGNEGRFSSKRQFQSLDSTFLEPAGKKSRQA
ncbi:hypothetical protein DL98DRAFT_462378 [Cadophora sp. DSE1049]|nr:hypothetical protein DL98DRAFT_462378 [Cadophora sp. DSE1049]